MIPLTMKPFTFFHNQGKKQPMETGPKKWQIFELVEKDFRTTIINIFNDFEKVNQ
jgi:hypothetical protein